MHRLKWKPPSENSIDFKLILRFPPSPEQPNRPDYFAKPVFELHVWCGGKMYEFWDVLLVKDEEWDRFVRHSILWYPDLYVCAADRDVVA